MPAIIWSRAYRCPLRIIETIDGFIAEHHVERPFNKRQRDQGEPQTPGRCNQDGMNSK